MRLLGHAELKRSAAAAVALAALLPDQLQQQIDGVEQLLELGNKWPAFDLRLLAEKVDDRHAEFGVGVRNDFPLSRRCQASIGDTDRSRDGVLHAAVV